MADIDSRLDMTQAQPIGVTTGPIRGSRKIHVATQTGSGIRVASVDDLPRRPSGRPVREAADAKFAEVRTRVQADPDSWERWFELSCAYDAAGDRTRARSAMRRAIALHDGAASESGRR